MFVVFTHNAWLYQSLHLRITMGNTTVAGMKLQRLTDFGGGGARGEARPPTCESPIQSAPLAYVTQETRKVRAGEL